MQKEITLSKREEFLIKTINSFVLLSMIITLNFPQLSLAEVVKPEVNSQTSVKAELSIEDKSNTKVNNVVVEVVLPEEEKVDDIAFTKYVTLTAYSSTVDQTDDTPFITANGSRVHNGTIAANFLKFGTRVRIPEYFGDRVFIVEDRTHPRYGDRVDIWMETREQALQFGIRKLKIEVLK